MVVSLFDRRKYFACLFAQLEAFTFMLGTFANVRANFKRPSFRRSFIDNLLGSPGLNSGPHIVDHALNIDADHILLITPILYRFSLADKRWRKNTCSKSSLRSHALVKVEFNVQCKMLPRSNGITQYSTIS